VTGGVALQAVVSGLSIGGVYGLVGLGFTLVWSLTSVLPFAHGDIVVGAVLLAVLAVVGTTPVALSPSLGSSVALVLLCLAAGVALSVLSYAAAVRPFVGARQGPQQVLGWVAGTVTAGLVLRAALGLALPAAAYAVPDPLHLDHLSASGVLALPGGGTVQVRAVAVLGIALVVAVAVDRLLLLSRAGRAMRAVADDVDAAALCGVPVERAVVAAFVLAGLLAAVAALLAAPARTVTVDSGVVLGLAGAAAALLGRLGSARGAVVGGLVLGVAQQLAVNVPQLGAGWSDVLPLAVLVVVLMVRPEGLRSGPPAVVE
jgi:branched-subunit amino acid ABC-type transport system permease component